MKSFTEFKFMDREGGYNMQDKNLVEMLHLLSIQEYITSEKLSKSLDISIRTIRNRIRDLNLLLNEHGACIESKPRFGYRISITNQNAYNLFINGQQEDEENIPVTREERILYLLFYFLNQTDYCKADDLIDQLYISKGTLSTDLKQMEEILNGYGIMINRRPNYGMRIAGKEFDIRRCMTRYLDDIESISLEMGSTKREELLKISRMIVEQAQPYDVRFQEIALDQFIKALYVQIYRIREDHNIDSMKQENYYLYDNEINFVKKLRNTIQERYAITINEEEEKYLSLHFAGKRMVNGKIIFENQENFIIHSYISELVNAMLDRIFKNANIDFRNNFQLIISLSQHMVPLDIRIRYGIYMENPMLEIIKEKYILSYNIAIQAVNVLNEYYKSSIVEDEIALFALIFALSLEQIEKKEMRRKFNILIVCNSGKALSQLLMVQFRQEFGEYIDQMYISDIFSLDTYDVSKIDYIFTTVPIQHHIPIPIQEINLFMEPSERLEIRKFLENKSIDKILNVYRRNHFFVNIQGDTKEEVLKNICKEIYKIADLEEGLYESVLRREMLSSTDYGNYCAIPHPDRIWSEKTYAFVSVLDHEILWNHHKVQVVFLILMGSSQEEQQKEFYEITTRMVTNQQAIQNLIENPIYDTLVKGLIRE